jgi:heme exporter protein B
VALSRTIAVVQKDIHSEIRNRFGAIGVALFATTCVSFVAFVVQSEMVSPSVASAMMWVIVFFVALTGLSRAFVGEGERKTLALLHLCVTPQQLFWGKFLGNLLYSFISTVICVVVTVMLVPQLLGKNYLLVFCVLCVGVMSMSSVITTISVMLVAAKNRMALLPVVSFPLLLPVVIPGVQSTSLCIAGIETSQWLPDTVLMISYAGVVSIIASFLYDVLWQE